MNDPTWTNWKSFRFPEGSGTPQHLKQAIRNGLKDIKARPELEPDLIMWHHIRECLAQKFIFNSSPALQHIADPKATWNRLFPEDTR